MKIYLAWTHDRHADVDVEVFVDKDQALAHAEEEAKQGARRDEDFEVHEPPPGDWLYYATYSVEGDYTRVTEQELQLPTEELYRPPGWEI